MAGPDDNDATYASTQVTQPASTEPFEHARDLTRGTIIGRYQLTTRLGAGAMGEVWAATDPQLERQIAIKLVHPRLACDPVASERMLREARAMAKVSHRAVIAIHDAGEVDGRLFLAMELVRGRTLGAALRARTPAELADWRRWLAIMIEAGRGLAAAHAAGVLHRDFKPDNIMVDEGGRVCVGDFGLARLGDGTRSRTSQPVIATDAVTSTQTELTMTGALLGTPIYMSLEQLYGEDVDARSDQFSFCVATYEALYGQRPFGLADEDNGNLVALAETVAAGAIPEPPAQSTVPHRVRAMLMRGLAPMRSDRWPDLDSLITALTDALARPERPRSARRRLTYVGLASGVIAIGLGIVMIARRSDSPELVRTRANATRLEPLPLNSTFAVSTGGRIATATDRVDVRDPRSGKTWTWTWRGPGWIDALEFETETILRWADHNQPDKRWRWDLASGGDPTFEESDGFWMASVVEGDLVEQIGATGAHEVVLEREGELPTRWPADAGKIEFASVAPSGHRFAYLATDRFAGHIVVIDTASHETWRSPQLVEPTGLGWRSDDELLYGTSDGWIAELSVGSSGFGVSRRVYHLDNGWAGRIRSNGDDVLFVAYAPSTRARVMAPEPSSARDFEPSVAAGEVGFTSDGQLVVWNERTHRLQRRTVTASGDSLLAKLDDVPANATFAGDLLIAAERSVGGRELVAISLSTGNRIWNHPIGASLLARCAGDLVEPCFVARRSAEPVERYDVVAIDPHTGTSAGMPLYHGPLEDIAVRGDGQRLLIANGSREIFETDLAGTVTARWSVAMTSVRSVAYDPHGGILVGGSFGRNYAVGRIDKELSVLSRADGELLSLVRASPTSGQVLILGRSLTSELWKLQLDADGP